MKYCFSKSWLMENLGIKYVNIWKSGDLYNIENFNVWKLWVLTSAVLTIWMFLYFNTTWKIWFFTIYCEDLIFREFNIPHSYMMGSTEKPSYLYSFLQSKTISFYTTIMAGFNVIFTENSISRTHIWWVLLRNCHIYIHFFKVKL